MEKPHRQEYEEGEVKKEAEPRNFEEAEKVLGEDFLGPESIKGAFGIELKEVPEIPFSKEELERAKKLNQQLVLYVDKAPDGKPLTGEKLFELTGNKTSDGKNLFLDTDGHKSEDFFTKETPRAGWRLASKETIPGSAGENYLEQTETIISYLQVKVFQGEPLPEEYQKAIKEFNEKKPSLEKIINSDWRKAAQELEKLEITKLTRETPIETSYRLALNERENKKRLLQSNYSWSSRRSSDGQLVFVGFFDSFPSIFSHGVCINKNVPDYSYDRLGVSFSRSF